MLLGLLFSIIAMFYASVGFGGGSSYLAVLALVVTSFFMVRSLALVCNIIVVSGSTYWFIKSGHFKLKSFLPFIVSSIPMAYIGARFRLKEEVFFVLLGLSLIAAAFFLFWQPKPKTGGPKVFSKTYAYALGACIGLLSGVVGIGGGIFLAPVLHYSKWEKARVIAALSSFFILVNSLAGFIGLVHAQTLALPWVEALFLGLMVFMGGQVGVKRSLKKISPQDIRRLTAVLVFLVGIRILLVNGLAVF